MIQPYFIEGTVTAGGAGVSTSTTIYRGVITGRVVGIGVVYRGSPPAGTTDLTVRTAGLNNGLPKVTLFATTDSATDVWRQPFVLKDDIAGADIAANYTEVVIHDQVEVLLAQANDGDSVDVTLLVER